MVPDVQSIEQQKNPQPTPFAKLWTPELLVLTALAVLTRFWALFIPHAVAFDEILYERFVGAYTTHFYYFDVHPPHARLILAAAAWLMGIPGTSLAGGHPQELLRILPALAGALIIPVFYILLRQLGAGRRVATLGALLLVVENGLLVISRFILVDSMLVLFGLAAVSLYLAARRRVGGARWRYIAASALMGGLSVSVKWTGLNALAIVGALWLVESLPVPSLWRFLPRGRLMPQPSSWRRTVGEALILMAIPTIVYVGGFAIHFALLYKQGIGDGFMSKPFRETLVGDELYKPTAHLSFAAKFVDLHRAMIRTNRHMIGQDAISSPWYTWPVFKRPICFWAGKVLDGGSQANLCMVGNVAVWWGTLLGLAVMIAAFSQRRWVFAPCRAALSVLTFAYLLSFLPFALIGRIMYIYSYFIALVYSVGLAVVGVGVLAGWTACSDADDETLWRFPSRQSRDLYLLVVTTAVAVFAYFAPISYGWVMSPRAMHLHVWLPAWSERGSGTPAQPSQSTSTGQVR